MDKKEESQHHDVIDKDLYEELDEEELIELVEEARQDALQKEYEREKRRKEKKPRFPSWIFWVIAIAMVMNIIAYLPQTISIPAIDFLKISATLSIQDDIITNYHVIEGNNTVTVAFKEEGLYTGTVKETYPEVDLAVLEIDGDDVPHLPLADEFTLTEDEAVYFIGNPLRFTGIANEGQIMDYANVKSKEEPVVMLDAPVYRGNSGSPVINHDGEVIGVIFATLDSDTEGRVGLFIPIDYFHEREG